MITNLDLDVTSEDIHDLFSATGEVKAAYIHTDQHGKSKGTAEVHYATRQEAQAAIDEYDSM